MYVRAYKVVRSVCCCDKVLRRMRFIRKEELVMQVG